MAPGGFSPPGTAEYGRAAPPAEEIFIDGKSYFSEKMKNPWDCESILSTYSNLDNNPATIGVGGRRKRGKNKKKKQQNDEFAVPEEEPVHQIMLSDKTGLPLGVLTSSVPEIGDDTYISVNKGEARRKNESKEEKKLRWENFRIVINLASSCQNIFFGPTVAQASFHGYAR